MNGGGDWMEKPRGHKRKRFWDSFCRFIEQAASRKWNCVCRSARARFLFFKNRRRRRRRRRLPGPMCPSETLSSTHREERNQLLLSATTSGKSCPQKTKGLENSTRDRKQYSGPSDGRQTGRSCLLSPARRKYLGWNSFFPQRFLYTR